MTKKIPDNAKMVFKGVIFDVYQWDELMFDGTTAVFEAVKKRDTVTVVATVGDNIILNDEEQPRREPFYALPAGMVENGSALLDNAKRELLEETGYTSDDWKEWFVSEPIKHPKVDWNNHFFIAKNCKKTGEQTLDAGEKITPRLITFEEFLKLGSEPKFRNKDLSPILEKAVRNNEEKRVLKELLGIHN